MNPSLFRVYPRASGGTPDAHFATFPDEGLSPRERGNPLPAQHPNGDGRSIPARAGEPGMRRA